MSNEIQVFSSTEFGELGIVTVNGKEMFPATDCAKMLGYADPTQAVRQHCKGGVKITTPSRGGPQQKNFIPEGDLYRLIVGSTLPSAEKFERWIFDEVLPSIRKYGAYMTPQKIEEVLLNPDTIISLAQALKSERAWSKALENKVEEDRPKVLFADSVSASCTSILVGELAKLLKQNGIDIGQNRLFQWLRNEGYLMKEGSSKNIPTQRAMEAGWFEVKESVINNPDGSVRVTKTTKVTGKGQVYFVNKFCGSKAA